VLLVPLPRKKGEVDLEPHRRFVLVPNLEQLELVDPFSNHFSLLLLSILRALCRAEVYRELVDESGWSPEEYEAWLADFLKGQLLLRRSWTSLKVSSTHFVNKGKKKDRAQPRPFPKILEAAPIGHGLREGRLSQRGTESRLFG
jgi:hypothetical protein